jgi:hypothetical protein
MLNSKADKLLDLLEGFKLGSLGARKKPAPEPQKPLKVLAVGAKDVQGRLYPYAYWQDSDGLRYGLYSFPFKKTTSLISLFVGENLAFEKERVLFSDIKFIVNKKEERSHEQIISLCDSYIHLATTHGIQSLIEHISKAFEAQVGFERKYDEWLKAHSK